VTILYKDGGELVIWSSREEVCCDGDYAEIVCEDSWRAMGYSADDYGSVLPEEIPVDGGRQVPSEQVALDLLSIVCGRPTVEVIHIWVDEPGDES